MHAFSAERYLREVTLPALSAGLAAAGRSRADVEVSMLAMIATGDTEEEMARAVAGTRQQIAFYGSTPTRPTRPAPRPGISSCGASSRSAGKSGSGADQKLARTPSATSSGLRSIRASP